MEILAENVYTTSHILLGIIIYGLIIGAAFLLYVAVTEKEALVSLIIGGFLCLFSWVGIEHFKSEPAVTYKVIIYDYNEVFNQGYEIISKNGDIYTIEKVDD
ncbi:hypothetical protein MM326_13830 [Alkalihalobacillus sp. LMS6]|uniref:hypothetical protein n=1 Tax=Alkalihalobacillus sp. LMS6 TaxID=2924034 RepID=UPI0020D18195|nr:hypothetical protein [Alkalihalobacillus sp. LMS6]UTR05182.1 hypothetical protein MM326_13830 [Alkalihalobacillus sp. LMS6]